MNGDELHMKNGICPKCGADNVRVQPRSRRRYDWSNYMSLNWWGSGVWRINYVCVTCGYLESYMDAADIKKVAQKWDCVQPAEPVLN